MKTNDLRLGNYVWNEVQEKAVKVDIKILQEQLNADKGFSDPLKPIPLTEDILVKCGFRKYTSGYLETFVFSYWNTIRTTRSQIEIGLDDINGPLGIFMSGNHVVYLRGLNQLQNLIYIMTGSELEINL